MLPLDISSNNNLLYSLQIIVILHIQSVNKMLAKKLIDDKTRDYMNARRVAKVIIFIRQTSWFKVKRQEKL